ncbi:hypothetical protein TeGR_g3972 [Tetraparma gracilis]|uniref:protein-tyrosine-phosphatase n=1 Tax=Tetraparma gracilis TaxID=2962635 RepID=A0ABQ6MWM3_9STRA|nr:hypothetical protein TeGR_g3972 [Tetraparma gracilis]
MSQSPARKGKPPRLSLTLSTGGSPSSPLGSPELPLSLQHNISEVPGTGVYVSGHEVVENVSLLMSLNIVGVVNCCAPRNTDHFPKHVRHLHLDMKDEPSFQIRPYFKPASDFIASCLETSPDSIPPPSSFAASAASSSLSSSLPSAPQTPSSRKAAQAPPSPKVLVHCNAGMSRSCSLLIAYLLRSGFGTLHHCFSHVKQFRIQCSPNPGFLDALLLEEEGMSGRRTMDAEKYRMDRFGDAEQFRVVGGGEEKGGESKMDVDESKDMCE